jgi:hypothetical protein
MIMRPYWPDTAASRDVEQEISAERMAALIAWLPIVRVDDLVKGLRPPEAAAP